MAKQDSAPPGYIPMNVSLSRIPSGGQLETKRDALISWLSGIARGAGGIPRVHR